MLAVEALFTAEGDGLRLRVDGTGTTLTCRVEGTALNLFASLRRSPQLLALARTCIPVLTRIGLRLDIVVGSRRVAHAGSGVTQNAAARLLKLPATHLGS